MLNLTKLMEGQQRLTASPRLEFCDWLRSNGRAVASVLGIKQLPIPNGTPAVGRLDKAQTRINKPNLGIAREL